MSFQNAGLVCSTTSSHFALETKHHSDRPAAPRDDHAVFLRLVDALLQLLLQVSHAHRLHKISFVRLPPGFLLTART